MSGFNPRRDYMLGEEEAHGSRVGGTGSAQTLGMSDEELERAKDKRPLGFHTGSTYPTPGEPCLSCGRRVPFPKTEKTPPTKRSAYWVPADEYDAHKENLADFAKFVGCYEQPFWEFKAMSILLAVGFQDEGLRGFAHRRPSYADYEVSADAELETQGLA